ncbi:MAG: class I SAM-dependent methyltransferase [Candidatus Dormibacteria bacterium]
MSGSYGTLATEVYDLDKPIGHSFGDVEYYGRLLAGLPGRILEPAVGTGRMLIPLLEAGVEVEGIDKSEEMLAVCRQHCRERHLDPVLRLADMTTFSQPGAYAAVIIPTGSITLLDGRGATLQALACFRECLQPGGRLLVDIPPPQLVVQAEPMRRWRRDPYLWTLQTQHIEYDEAANQTTRWLRYEKWQDGALIASELQPFCLQHWSIGEFQQLLGETGFGDVTVTADYCEHRAPGRTSEVWTFQACRT